MLPRSVNSLWLFSCIAFALGAIAADGALPQKSQHFAITGSNSGVTSQSGSRPFRRNILDLQKDGPAWSLYVQALDRMQKVSESSQLSYFQVAGIHGRPYIAWNNISEVPGAAWRGYCTHNSALFLTWHRPYLALFEQILIGHAQDIAGQYPASISSVYKNAANNLRMPYWDWASTPTMPDIINRGTVQVTTPTGVKSVSNPLLQYNFQNFPFDPALFPSNSIYANDPHTVRSPNTASSESNPTAANNELANSNLMGRTWTTLVKSKDFNSFSTTAVSGPSLEAIHNDVHVDVGGSYGHMISVEYSAFDPSFWLHHTNVDRLYAMWQAVNPESSMTPLSEPGTYALLRNSIDTVDTPLPPFTYDTAGNTYTSASSSNTKTFGYTYPEIEDWHQSPEQLKANVSAQINRMYDPNGMFSKKSRSTSRSIKDRSAHIPGSKIREWSIAVEVSKFALNGEAFVVRFFVGDIPSDPKDRLGCTGSVVIMPPPRSGDGPMPDIILHDEISLVKPVEESAYDSINVGDVVPFLKGGLKWKIQKLDGTVVENDKVPSLKVTVFDQMVDLPKDITELPIYGDKTIHAEITETKLSGYKC